MKRTLSELHHERGRLEERIALQRRALSAELVPVRNAFNIGDRISQTASEAVVSGRALVHQYPLVVVAVVGLVVIAKPRAVLGLAQRGLGWWRTWRSARAMLPDFLLRQML